MVKASEDKTFPGAIAAGLGSPWGQAVSAGDLPDGKANYFGSYREVFARDLYEAFTGLLVAGDTATAQAATRFLFERQQLADGRMPRNSLPNGKKAPDTGGDQLDESSYPILMAWQSGLAATARSTATTSRRPPTSSSRTGRRSARSGGRSRAGFSPSTIAAEIAGLVAAGRIADVNGDPASRAGLPGHGRLLPALDQGLDGHHHRSVRAGALLHPAVQDRRPERGDHLQPRQRRPERRPARGRRRRLPGADPARRAAGERPGRAGLAAGRGRHDPDARPTPAPASTGTAPTTPAPRTGTATASSPTRRTARPDGKPWPTGNVGSGHYWPVLSGERAEQQLQTGDRATAQRCC